MNLKIIFFTSHGQRPLLDPFWSAKYTHPQSKMFASGHNFFPYSHTKYLKGRDFRGKKISRNLFSRLKTQKLANFAEFIFAFHGFEIKFAEFIFASWNINKGRIHKFCKKILLLNKFYRTEINGSSNTIFCIFYLPFSLKMNKK